MACVEDAKNAGALRAVVVAALVVPYVVLTVNGYVYVVPFPVMVTGEEPSTVNAVHESDPAHDALVVAALATVFTPVAYMTAAPAARGLEVERPPKVSVPVVVMGPPRIGNVVFTCVTPPPPAPQALPVVVSKPPVEACTQFPLVRFDATTFVDEAMPVLSTENIVVVAVGVEEAMAKAKRVVLASGFVVRTIESFAVGVVDERPRLPAVFK